MKRIITITTDFGLKDYYVPSLVGQIRTINPQVEILNISHQITRQNILEAAFILKNTLPYLPEKSIHLVVVDPEVGSNRDAVAVFHQNHFFIAPDNGLLTLVLDTIKPEAVYSISSTRYSSETVSPVFHGRDIFGPVAAWLSAGVAIHLLGDRKEFLTDLRWSLPVYDKHRITGQVIHIDNFGNAISNISNAFLKHWAGSESVQVSLSGWDPVPLSRIYSDVEPGDPVALIGSGGLLEVAVYNANAADLFDIRTGSQVVVERIPS